jgi:steroid 5-alpha reductase family enzyme
MQVSAPLPLHYYSTTKTKAMLTLYFEGLLIILSMMTLLWIVSIFLKNVSIVDLFWGMGFVLANAWYFFMSDDFYPRKIILFSLVTIWGLRLSIYLAWRNIGKGEDYRYQEFRRNYGENRYWWVSYFQTFLLQGMFMWLISMPLLGANYLTQSTELNGFDYAAMLVWLVGFIFEAGGDYQLARFKANQSNKGKVLNTGLWRYTRHPNYFGDSAVWWAYGLFCIASGNYWLILGSLFMTLLIIKVSGVALLEKSLKDKKPEYQDYIRKTNSFFPWFPKK